LPCHSLETGTNQNGTPAVPAHLQAISHGGGGAMTSIPILPDDEPPRELPQDLQVAVKKALVATRILTPPPRYNDDYWREEREAIAHMAVWQAARAYRPEIGVSRELFALLCAKRAIYREWHKVREWDRYEEAMPIDEETGEEVEFPDAEAQEAIEWAVVIREVQEALDRLSEAERQLIEWHYGDEALSIREIAGRLGVSKSMAHERLQRAIARLRSECGGVYGLSQQAIQLLTMCW
jgi:RNA polymerase sigma factor (sigma-70 family)